MFSHQQTKTLKRTSSHFELDSPFSETVKRKKYSSQIKSNDNTIGSTGRLLSPISFIYEENRIYQLKQNSTEQQCRHQNRSNNSYNNTNSNNSNNHVGSFMTSTLKPLNQTKITDYTNSIHNTNSEPYYEVEDYMVKGYENMQYSSDNTQFNNSNTTNNNTTTNNNSNGNGTITSIQYSLYDLTQEELDMMMIDNTTVANINTIC